MINCTCFVQAGQQPDLKKQALHGLLNQFTTEAFGAEAQVAWIPVPEGSGFTAGQPSTSSVVSMTAGEPLSAARRESLLRQFVGLWTEETGCSVDEVVAVISDPVAN